MIVYRQLDWPTLIVVIVNTVLLVVQGVSQVFLHQKVTTGPLVAPARPSGTGRTPPPPNPPTP